jgi:hypothetical protein
MSTPHAPATLYTRKQTAALLGITPMTLSRWAQQGRGPTYARSGVTRGRVWYTPADVMAWIETRKAGGEVVPRHDHVPPKGGALTHGCMRKTSSNGR